MFPDLLLMDGGKGQLSAALGTFSELRDHPAHGHFACETRRRSLRDGDRMNPYTLAATPTPCGYCNTSATKPIASPSTITTCSGASRCWENNPLRGIPPGARQSRQNRSLVLNCAIRPGRTRTYDQGIMSAFLGSSLPLRQNSFPAKHRRKPLLPCLLRLYVKLKYKPLPDCHLGRIRAKRQHLRQHLATPLTRCKRIHAITLWLLSILSERLYSGDGSPALEDSPVKDYFSCADAARLNKVRPRDVSDLFYSGELDGSICPNLGNTRVIPRAYLPTIREVLARKGILKSVGPDPLGDDR